MCFYISDKHPNAMVAKKDISVYKILERVGIENKKLTGLSPYKTYEWTQGKLAKAEIKSRRDVEIDEGLHAFVKLSIAKILRNNSSKVRTICECIIPKGAIYYINSKEIVSNKMILTGRVYSLTSKRWVKFGRKLYKKRK